MKLTILSTHGVKTFHRFKSQPLTLYNLAIGSFQWKPFIFFLFISFIDLLNIVYKVTMF